MLDETNMHCKEPRLVLGEFANAGPFCFSKMLARRVLAKLGGAARRFGVTTIEPWAGNPCVVRVTNRPDWGKEWARETQISIDMRTVRMLQVTKHGQEYKYAILHSNVGGGGLQITAPHEELQRLEKAFFDSKPQVEVSFKKVYGNLEISMCFCASTSEELERLKKMVVNKEE
jgi:hypothetical protein